MYFEHVLQKAAHFMLEKGFSTNAGISCAPIELTRSEVLQYNLDPIPSFWQNEPSQALAEISRKDFPFIFAPNIAMKRKLRYRRVERMY